jgi:hypothetical protein
LEQKSSDDPLPCCGVHRESFGKQMQKAQAQQKSSSKGQEQRHVLFEAVADPFSEQSAH